MFIAGFVVGAGWFGVLYFRLKHKTGAYERKLEKTAVQNSSSTSRAEVLEAKIKVLEKALDDALNNQR
jgi:uncharacterized membrane protein YciS (DUF1049 family)